MKGRGCTFICPLAVFLCVAFPISSMSSGANAHVSEGDAIGILSRLLPGWRLEGDVDVGFSMDMGGKKAPGTVTMRVSINNGAFSDPTERFAAEGVNAVVRLRGPARLGEQLPLEVELSIKRGSFLWDRWFFEHNGPPIKLRVRGILNRTSRTIRELQGSVDWAGLLRCSLNGRLRAAPRGLEGKLDWRMALPSHQALLSKLAESVEGSGTWDEIRSSGHSTLEGTLEVDRRHGWQMKGVWMIQGASFELGGQSDIRWINGEIPFHILFNSKLDGSSAESGRWPLRGRLEMKGISLWDGLKAQDLDLPILAAGNRLAVAGAVQMKVAGGTVRLERLEFPQLLPFPPTMVATLKARSLRLNDLLKGRVGLHLRGRISADLPEITLDHSGKLRAPGWISLRLLGGEVRITNLWATRALSRFRRWGCDVSIEDIDLEEATSQIPLGRMGGQLDGYIKGLSIAFGQPDAFELWLSSDPSSRKRKYIDAKAVENLSIISGGVKAPLPPFFKVYPYSKLGIYCKLENDVFTLRGTIRKGGREYLIKRGFLRGINVVNRNPDNRIPWRDMIQRIRRVFPQVGEGARIEMGK